MVFRLSRFAASSLLLLTISPALQAQFPGAVYTTDRQAGLEDCFGGKKSVYVAGGPSSSEGCAGEGLPDGAYYFQVTDPSGMYLLSSDDLVHRQVLVIGGVFRQVPPGGHALKNGPCGSKIVQLRPFRDTPGKGHEYRVWFTPVAAYTPGAGHHGFLAGESKTDSFLVREQGCAAEHTVLRGTVFYDIDEDGSYDPLVPGELPIPGWKIEIESGGMVHQIFTDADGSYQFLRERDFATHVLSSDAPSPGFIGTVGGRWLATGPNPVPVIADLPEVVVDFGKLFFVNTPEYARSKGYWHNQGRDEIQACDPEWRTMVNGLSLRTNFSNPDGEAGTLFTVSNGTPFDTAFAELSGYLVGTPANGVLANILSVQYCAANLNRLCGPLQGTTYIDRFYDDVLVSFEEMAAATLGLLSDPRSANSGPHGDQEWREMIMGCLREWEGMNSEGDNVFSRSESAPIFATPYF